MIVDNWKIVTDIPNLNRWLVPVSVHQAYASGGTTLCQWELIRHKAIDEMTIRGAIEPNLNRAKLIFKIIEGINDTMNDHIDIQEGEEGEFIETITGKRACDWFYGVIKSLAR